MTERLLKATLNPNQTNKQTANMGEQHRFWQDYVCLPESLLVAYATMTFSHGLVHILVQSNQCYHLNTSSYL